jgi:hypothetical protein
MTVLVTSIDIVSAGLPSLDVVTFGVFSTSHELLKYTLTDLSNSSLNAVSFVAYNVQTSFSVILGASDHYRLVVTGLTSGSTITITDTICFYPGTMVATPSGPRAVETLAIGDLVMTSEGEAKPVRWMGRQTVSTRFADPLRVLPIRIRAGALGDNLPVRDLLISADHALLVDGVLVEASALINGDSIRREHDVPERFTYHHVELADHSLILAEGVAAETFVDNVNRLAFDNWAEHEALYGDLPNIVEMELPRARSARQVPMRLRAMRDDKIAA